MPIDIQVTGIRELDRDLTAVAHDLDDPDHALSDVSRDLARRAAQFAPRLTGTLAASVHPTGRLGYAEASTSLVYAGPINYGRPDHNIAPTRFMDRALAAGAGPARDRIDQGVSTLIRRKGLA